MKISAQFNGGMSDGVCPCVDTGGKDSPLSELKLSLFYLLRFFTTNGVNLSTLKYDQTADTPASPEQTLILQSLVLNGKKTNYLLN